MPTAAAIAAAAATAKIQAMEAVANTAAALGLAKNEVGTAVSAAAAMHANVVTPAAALPGVGVALPTSLGASSVLGSSLGAPATLASSLGGLSSAPVIPAVPPPGLAIPGVGVLPVTLATTATSRIVTTLPQPGVLGTTPAAPVATAALLTGTGTPSISSALPASLYGNPTAVASSAAMAASAAAAAAVLGLNPAVRVLLESK